MSFFFREKTNKEEKRLVSNEPDVYMKTPVARHLSTDTLEKFVKHLFLEDQVLNLMKRKYREKSREESIRHIKEITELKTKICRLEEKLREPRSNKQRRSI